MSFLLAACGLKKLLPEGPAISETERTRDFGVTVGSGVDYTGQATSLDFPVMPLQAFGATYDIDLVLVSQHPEWNMHEYAMLRTVDGPVWMAKDARESTMLQTIIADLPDIEDWLPEVPLDRRAAPVTVTDRSTDTWLDLDLKYVNWDGEAVEVHYEGKPPRSLQRKRNGSTMGHSASHVLVALDLSHRDFGRRASMSISGEKVRIKRILGLIPFQMALQQTQGGLAVGTFTQHATEAGFDTVHASGARQSWVVSQDGAVGTATQTDRFRTLTNTFHIEDGAWELAEIRVEQWGQDQVTTRVNFNPALPDPRRTFDGDGRARFVIDVNGQMNHAVGRVVCRWADGRFHADIRPEAPWWVIDRPLRTTVDIADEVSTTTITRAALP